MPAFRPRVSVAAREGLRTGFSIALGYFPVAVAFGLAARQAGLSAAEAALSSLVVYAGASQFVLAGLLAQGATFVAAAATALLLNVRHVLFGASLAPHARRWPRWQQAVLAFGLTDEAFAAASSAVHRGFFGRRFLGWTQAVSYASWVLGTLVGAYFQQSLPAVARDALSFALTALFVALLIPALKHRSDWVAAAVGGAVAAGASYLGSLSLGLFAAGVVGASAGWWLGRTAGKDGEAGENAGRRDARITGCSHEREVAAKS